MSHVHHGFVLGVRRKEKGFFFSFAGQVAVNHCPSDSPKVTLLCTLECVWHS